MWTESQEWNMAEVPRVKWVRCSVRGTLHCSDKLPAPGDCAQIKDCGAELGSNTNLIQYVSRVVHQNHLGSLLIMIPGPTFEVPIESISEVMAWDYALYLFPFFFFLFFWQYWSLNSGPESC
jgi:hypothetical protein